MTARVAIVDAGSGNIPNVERAFQFLGIPVQVIRDPDELSKGLSHMVLPGVGQYGSVLSGLSQGGWLTPISDWLKEQKPFLSICVGLQILLEGSEESPEATGLGIYKGTARHFDRNEMSPGVKIPHMGWNRVDFDEGCSWSLDSGYAYFVHSYYVPDSKDVPVAARTSYDKLQFASALQLHDRGLAVQFHPEKSGPWGLQLLKTFGEVRS